MQFYLWMTVKELVIIIVTSLNQGESRHSWAVIRWEDVATKREPIKSFPSFEMSAKYSSGKQKSHLSMFAVVSSTESSKKGDTPL